MCVASLFVFLGWKLSENKSVDFDGVKLDMRSAKLGVVMVSNTEERIGEFSKEVDDILAAGTLPRKEGERLRGRLRFGSAQLFGRTMRQRMRDLGKRISSGC